MRRFCLPLLLLALATPVRAGELPPGADPKGPAAWTDDPAPGQFRDADGRGYRLHKRTKRGVVVRYEDPAGFTVQVDRRRQRSELHLDTCEEDGRSYRKRIFRSLDEALVDHTEPSVPALALHAQAKAFDDQLMLALERLIHEGTAAFPGRAAFLKDLASALDAAGHEDLAALARADEAVWGERRREDDPFALLPIGIAEGDGQAQRWFVETRLLQTPLRVPEATRLRATIRGDADLRRRYEAQLEVTRRLHNPLLWSSALERPRRAPPSALLPPMRALESLAAEGFRMAGEHQVFGPLVRLIQEGRIRLTPGRGSGWYDWQIYALEPLLRLDRAPEFQRIETDEDYRAMLIDNAAGFWAGARESQGSYGIAGALGRRLVPRLQITRPARFVHRWRPSIEPLAEHYRRRAEGYRYLQGALRDTLGESALRGTTIAAGDGPTRASLWNELDFTARLFEGAYLLACYETGHPPRKLSKPDAALAAIEAFKRWMPSAGLLHTDLRTLVPVSVDAAPGSEAVYTVWLVLGVVQEDLDYRLERQPRVRVFRGERDVTDKLELSVWDTSYLPGLRFVFVEGRMKRLVTRTELRRELDAGPNLGEALRRLGDFDVPNAYTEAGFAAEPIESMYADQWPREPPASGYSHGYDSSLACEIRESRSNDVGERVQETMDSTRMQRRLHSALRSIADRHLASVRGLAEFCVVDAGGTKVSHAHCTALEGLNTEDAADLWQALVEDYTRKADRDPSTASERCDATVGFTVEHSVVEI